MTRTIHNSGPGSCSSPARADLKALVDGELFGLRALLTRRHLARCTDCRAEAIWLRQMGAELQSLESATPPAHLRASILASLPLEAPLAIARRENLRAKQPERASATPLFRAAAPRFALGVGLATLALGGVFAMNRSLEALAHPDAGRSPAPAAVAQRDRTPVRSAHPSQVPGPAPVVTTALPPDEDDPISRQASVLAGQREGDLADQEKQRIADSWMRLVGDAREAQGAPTPGRPTVVRVEVVAPDASAVRIHVMQWGRLRGVRFGADAGVKAAPSSLTAADAPMVARLRVERGAGLISLLRQQGDLGFLPPMRTSSLGSATSPGVQASTGTGYRAAPAVPTGADAGFTGGAAQHAAPTAIKPDEPVLLLIYLRKQI